MKRRSVPGDRRLKPIRRAAPRPARGETKRVPPTIRVLVADEKAIDRAGFVAILRSQSDFEIIGEASTADEAIRVCRDRRPSVVILSVSLPAPAGMTPISAIREHEPKLPILAVARLSEAACVILNPPHLRDAAASARDGVCSAGTDCLELAVAEGAAGTIRRTAAPSDLFGAVRSLAAGKAWFEAGTASAIMRHALACQGTGGVRKSLSKREVEVSGQIADGRSNKEIALALGIHETTVKKHVGHILAKLNLQDRLQVGIHLTRNPLLLSVVETPRR
jgi:DNA-binding NarL/FixJ family response regulator